MKKLGHYAQRNPVTCSAAGVALLFGLSYASKVTAYDTESAVQPQIPEFAVGHAPVPAIIGAAITVQAPPRHGPRSVDLSYLKRPALGYPLNAYVGVRGQLPAVADLDFAANLDYLWQRKLAIKGVSPATQKSARIVSARYRSVYPDTKGVRQFVRGISAQESVATRQIHWSALCAKLRVDAPQCGALQVVSGRLGGHELAAYGMTELFPGFNGKFNYVLLDTLLRNAGENYLASIPALGDTRLSLGFYQFTSDAVYAAEKREGANVVDQFNPKSTIGGSVVSLTSQQHHRAAKLFAVYNLARMMQSLTPSQAATLSSGACSKGELTQFVATAHHMPTLAIKRAKEWVAAGCRKPLAAYLGPHLREYAAKTAANYAALKEKL